MAITLFFFCSLLLGTSLGQGDGNDRVLNQVLKNVGDVVNQGVGLPHEKVALTTRLANSGLEHGANIARMGVAAGTTLSSQGLRGGTDIGKQSLDLVGTISEIAPGGSVARYVTDAGKKGLDISHNLGQKGIKGTNYVGNEVIDKTKTLTTITTGTLENLSSAGTGLTQETVSTGLNAVANVGNTIMDAATALIPRTAPQPNAIPEIPPVPKAEPAPTPEPNGISSIFSNGLSYITG
uniref:Hemolysin-like secreted salivary protein n=1 Tax=Panstrongylus lignarius TaxID=156445 RepID=A0A224XWU4_9HEMI